MHFISSFFYVAYLLLLYNKQFWFYVDLVVANALVYKIFTKSSKVFTFQIFGILLKKFRGPDHLLIF